jgi:hypothetical protein
MNVHDTIEVDVRYFDDILLEEACDIVKKKKPAMVDRRMHLDIVQEQRRSKLV